MRTRRFAEIVVADRSHRYRPGHHLDARHRVRWHAAAACQRAAGTAPDLSGAWRGRARPGGNLGGDGGDRACRDDEGRARGQGYRWHRHHQSARNDGRMGPRHRPTDPPGNRLAGPAHCRFLRPLAPHRPCAGGCRQDRTAARPLFFRQQDRLAARTCKRRACLGRGGPARLRHHRLLSAVAPHRRQGPRNRCHQCRAHAVVRYFARAMGRRAVPHVRRADIAVAAGRATALASSASAYRNYSARPSAFSAWPATSRRRPSGRVASRPA